MTHRFHRLWSVLLLAMPGAAFALGLGEIHLESGLNQPLSAQIELVGASAEELTQLRASVASREVFLRYGVDRPAFLSTISFKVGQDANGRPVLIVRSGETVTEPFVTFLVDVTWPRGKLTREYTLLLDPPVFSAPASGQAAAETEVQAPVSGATAGPKAAPITRKAEAPAAMQAPSVEGGTYTVVANDTLGAIARRSGARTGSELNRTMIGIFRANPNAFYGNINRLRRGATLAIPSGTELANVSAAEAAREVHEQMNAWRAASGAPAMQASSAGAAPAKGGARLRLVMPNEAADKAGAGTDATKGKGPTPEQQAAENKRLLDLKNAGLAKLQQATAAPAAKPVPAPPVVAGKPAPATNPAPATATPAPADNATAATAADAKPKPKPHVVKPVAPAQPSLLDTLNGLLLPIAGGLALLIAAGAFLFLRKRRASDVSEALGQLDAAGTYSSRAERDHAFSDPMGVEETPREDNTVPAGRAGAFDPSATMSTEAAINLEHADPLAEADFHMAYGLYDQAADIVKLAMEREPDRRDLRLKLLEVYFVWSNKDAFLDVARGLARDRDHAPAGEWDKVAIMGRQIAPDEALFADSAGRAAGAGGVDLDLAPDGHTDTPGMDLEFLGEDSSEQAFADVDLDLDRALSGHDSLADTGESLALKDHGLDFDLDSTQERPGQAHAIEPTVERPGLSMEHTDTIDVVGMDLPAQRGSAAATRTLKAVEPPTIESPALHLSEAPTVQAQMLSDAVASETVREQIGARDYATLAGAADQTAELSLDDLSFEIDQLNATSIGLHAEEHGAMAGAAQAFASGGGGRTSALASEPTRIAPRPAAFGRDVSEEATRIAPRAPIESLSSDSSGSIHVGDTGGDIDFDLEQLAASLDKKDTSHTGAHNGLDHDLDFDLSDASLSGHHGHNDSTQIATAQIDASELAMHDLEPATLSEVGTKIDLARAYMDMGDPEGARSILQEVLTEGSASQRQEAQRLMVGLPG